jgi:hypothetical protein
MSLLSHGSPLYHLTALKIDHVFLISIDFPANNIYKNDMNKIHSLNQNDLIFVQAFSLQNWNLMV